MSSPPALGKLGKGDAGGVGAAAPDYTIQLQFAQKALGFSSRKQRSSQRDRSRGIGVPVVESLGPSRMHRVRIEVGKCLRDCFICRTANSNRLYLVNRTA